MKWDSIIFDLDGTLWDASKACIQAWNNSLDQFGITGIRVTDKIVAGFSGRLLEDILAASFPLINPDQYNEFITIYAREESFQMDATGGQLYADTKEALLNLSRDFPLFIVSNCQKGYIERFLMQHKLENLFRDFECSGNTGKTKKENIASIISKNKLGSPVYVGDTEGDRESSEWNQIPFIYASYGFGEVRNSVMKIESLTDLIGLAKSYNG